MLPRQKNTTSEWDDGGKISNTNKLIQTEIFPSVHETLYLKLSLITWLSAKREFLLMWSCGDVINLLVSTVLWTIICPFTNNLHFPDYALEYILRGRPAELLKRFFLGRREGWEQDITFPSLHLARLANCRDLYWQTTLLSQKDRTWGIQRC